MEQGLLRPGTSVLYVDEFQQEHGALLTAVWDNGNPVAYPNPAVNLVLVSPDDTRTDTYGRQIERKTSVSHLSGNSAKANCWKRVGE